MAVLGKAIRVKEELSEEDAIKLFQMKRLIKNVELARGDGTSMITLIMKPGEQVSKMVQKLGLSSARTDVQSMSTARPRTSNRVSTVSPFLLRSRRRRPV